ncbi:cullin binding protein CanA [Xylariaceae sp. FL0804]|nr:cullin binding protein CanA [Xylariaceae sp. FL0804]
MASAVNNTSPQAISQLLTKLNDADPDFRFMSLNDLLQILTRAKPDFLTHDYNTASRISDAVIKTLDDQNGEVQNLAVKCVGPMIARVPLSVVATALEKISTIEIKNSVDNSLPALALRDAISSLQRPVRGVAPSRELLETYAVVSRVLIPRILNVAPGDSQGLLDNDEPSPEAVDVLIEVVRCFGPLLSNLEIEKLEDVVVQLLERKKTPSPVKKRAVVALAILAPYLSDPVLKGLMERMKKPLKQKNLDPITHRLYITIMGSLARSIPYQFGAYLPEFAPIVLATLDQAQLQEHLDAVAEGDDHGTDFNELREVALVAVDSFLASCGAQMRPFTDETISACLRYVKFDPNRAMQDDEDDDMMEEDEDSADELGDDDEYDDASEFNDDDDDASWKIRRCAAKAIYTLISTRSADLLDQGTLYQRIARPLTTRLDVREEREESVRLEVISTISLLVRKTGEGVVHRTSTDDEQLLQSQPGSRKRRRPNSVSQSAANKAPFMGAIGLHSPTQESIPESGPRADLSQLTPLLVNTATKLLKGKQIATKQAIVNLLDDLILVQNGGLADYFEKVMQPVIDVIRGTAGTAGSTSTALSGGAASATITTLRVAVLRFTSDIVKTHSSRLFLSHLPRMVAGVVSAVHDRFYKISSEAIRTAEELVKAITPPRAKPANQKYQPELLKLYDIIVDRVSANDADTEVRQKAIQALGTLIARTSTAEGLPLLPAAKRRAALDLLLDRMRNETTRLHSVRAIDNIAQFSSVASSLDSDWVQPVALELCGQLRKSNRALRGASIQALQHLIVCHAVKGLISADTANKLVGAILPVLSANDTHLLSPALVILGDLQLQNPQSTSTPELVQALCFLLKNNITGMALDSFLRLVDNVGQTGGGRAMMQGILQVGVAGDPAVVGQAAGRVFVASGGEVGAGIDDFIAELNSARESHDTARQSLALAVLGEIGLRLGPKSRIRASTFSQQFHDEPDKVSVAAAVALGRAGAGNIPDFLPTILSAIQEPGSRQYLLLQSIREVLHQIVLSSTDVGVYEGQIWELLFSASQIEDNKATCAECIGRLAILKPGTYIPKLQELMKSSSEGYRGVAVQALRYTLPDSDETFDAELKPILFNMVLTVLKDDNLEIRRLGMTTLNSATHNKPEMILPHLGELTPYIMHESVVKKELIREVQMGPFKHLVDDGLEVRKSAYETLYALMETAFSRVSSLEFYDRVIAGLGDDNDIRSLCNLMLSKLIVIDPEEVTRRLDTIAECYRKTLSTKLKDGAVKQEVEKQEEANKSVLRVSLLLAEKTKTTLPGPANGAPTGGQPATSSAPQPSQQASQNPGWQQYWEWVNKDFERQLKALREETRDLPV